MAQERIIVTSLAHVHYQHPDVQKAADFFNDFGLVEVQREPSKVYLRGSSVHPYVYLAEQSPDDTRHFIGGYWVVADFKELEKAAKHPGASPIRDNEGPGGGKVVTLKDPLGFVVGFIHGQTLRDQTDGLQLGLEISSPTPNTATEKLRKGDTRRFKHGPSPVFKLGHYGIVVPAASYEETMKWYTSVLNLKPTDSMFDPKSGKEVTCFTHIDLGPEYADHHSFFAGSSATATAAHPHHCSFEINDFNTQTLGHDWLRNKGWTNCWGIGRHILGSQIFDYWFDSSGNVVEHYSDGDVVNEDTPFEKTPAGPGSLAIWGPKLPLAFLTGKLEDAGKVAVAPPNVAESKPAQYEQKPAVV